MNTLGAGPEPPIGSPEPEVDFSDVTAARRSILSRTRTDSIVPTAGREGVAIAPRFYKGRSMAVFTSGGDASGMFYGNTPFVVF